MQDDGITLVFLTQGRVAMIDTIDADDILRHSWCFADGYAKRKVKNRSALIRMHRQILAAPDGVDVDHINGNTLDNRRCNLRLATRSQNHANRKVLSRNTSGFRGVRWDKARNIWRAEISVGGKPKFLGRFACPQDAARAYDAAASATFGEFANLNFPDH